MYKNRIADGLLARKIAGKGAVYEFSGSGVRHKGEYDSATGKYWAEYEIPESLIGQTLNIYASYIGGSNGGDAQWHMRNLKLEIVEWR